MPSFNNEVKPDQQCNPYNFSSGGWGVTIWNPNGDTNSIELLGGDSNSKTIYFTLTRPQCFGFGNVYDPNNNKPHKGPGTTQVCNFTYTIHTDDNTHPNQEVGPITMWLNGYGQGTPHYLSGQAGHDVTETQDFAPATDSNGQPLLIEFGQNGILNITPSNPNDPLCAGINSIKFTNNDPYGRTVHVNGARIIREYSMQDLTVEMGNQCSQEVYHAPQQGEIPNRVDYPCNGGTNYEPCGHVSATAFGGDNTVPVIAPGQTVQWTWTNPPDQYNGYVGKMSCLFNFNNVVIPGQHPADDASTADVQFSIKVNSSNWAPFYHTNIAGHHMFHSVDLATHPILSASGGYNDAPNAINILSLTNNQPNTGVSLALCDGCDSNCNCSGNGGGGNVNIYRVYQSVCICNRFTVTPVQSYGGQITPTNQETPWAYGTSRTYTITPNSGYVTSHVYVNNVDQGPVNTITLGSVTHDTSIIPSFTGIPYQLTVNWDSSQGTVSSPASGTYNCGAAIAFSATPNSGYRVLCWTLYNNDTNQLVETYMGAYFNYSMPPYDFRAQATFQRTYTLTVAAPQGGGSSNPGVGNWLYDSGTNVQVTATPTYGNAFSYWLLDGNNAGTSTTINISMTANHSIQPVFVALPLELLIVTAVGYNQWGGLQQCNVGIYLDNNYVGTGYVSIEVLAGPHTLYVDNSSGYFICFNNGNNYVYTDPETIQVTNQTVYVTAYFY